VPVEVEGVGAAVVVDDCDFDDGAEGEDVRICVLTVD
jgi:hypothetical protein